MDPESDRAAINPILGLSISVTSASTAAVLIRLSSANPLAVAAFRLTFATLVLLPFVAWNGLGRLRDLTRRDAASILFIGSCLAAHFALWITSLYLTTVAASVLLVSTSPVFVAFLGHLFLGERVTVSVSLGIGLAMAGVAAMMLPQGALGGGILGMALALGGAAAVSGYLLAGRRIRQRVHLIPYVFWVYATAAVLLVVLCLLLGVRLVGLPQRDYVIFLLLGIVPSHLGHTLYNYLLRYVRARVVAVSTLAEPVLSSLLAVAVLKEVPPLSIVVAAPLVLVGIYLSAAR